MEIGTELSEDILEITNSQDKSKKKTSINENYDSKELLNDSKNIKIDSLNNIKSLNKTKNKLSHVNEPSNYYFYKKLGNCFSFFGNKNGDPLFIIGPNWKLYIIFSLTMAGFYYFELIYFWNLVNFTPKMLGIIIFIIFYLSYTYTFLINPGYPKHDIDSRKGEPRNKFSYCNICKMWVNKEKNVSHCMICNICIEENDHHCVWTSKCIGDKNIHSFNIFVIFTCILIVYAMIISYLAHYSYLYLEENKER